MGRDTPPFTALAVRMVAVGVVYYVTGRLSLELALVGESVTPLWPPTGIALVGFLVFGYRVWPAVAAAAFLVNWPISATAIAAAGIAAGNTLAPVAATALLRWAKFRPELDRTRDAVALVLLGALGGMTVSATVGSFSLERSGTVAGGEFWTTWTVWWAGDAMGILAVAPFLLGLRSMRLSRSVAWARVGEAVVLFGAIGFAAVLLNTTARPVWAAVFPLLVWIAWRFQQRGAGPAALLVIGAASWAAAHHAGPFTGAGLLQQMVALQVFNAAVALTSFFFAVVVAERIVARQALERSARELYQREHRIAATLQRSLLPEELSTPPDIEVSARYIPATGEMEVGGDWYDVIPLPDGRLGVAIGDVTGHGLAAAAAMGQIRMALRAYAMEGFSPSQALRRLNVLMTDLQPGVMATLAYGRMDPDTGALTLAKAGHPPPLVVTPGGAPAFVSNGLAPPLGVDPLVSYDETTVELPPGSTVLLYTDGLVERRGESIERGLERLAAAVAESPSDLEGANDHILSLLAGEEAWDDTAILAIRRLALAGRPLRLAMTAEPGTLSPMRRVLGRWLRQNGTGDDEVSEILVACSEAAANAAQHAYGSKEGRMELEANRDGEVVTVAVRDFGSWRSDRRSTENEGRGLMIMRGLMDGVEVNPSIEGTEVRMTRRVGVRLRHG